MKKVKISYKELYVLFLKIYLISLPLNSLVIGSIGSMLKIIAVFPVLIAILGCRDYKLHLPLLFQLGFTVFAGLSILWSVSSDDSIERVNSYVQLLALLVSGECFKYSSKELQGIKDSLIWSSRLTALVVLFFADYSHGRLWLSGVLNEDPNYICAYFAYGIANAMQQLTTQERKKRTSIAVIELVVYAYIVLGTGSRGGLIAILVGVAAYIMTYAHQSKGQFLKKTLIILLIIIIGVALLNILPDSLRDRFTIEDVVESGGTGRIEIWKNAWHMHVNAPILRRFFGYGTATILDCFERFRYSTIKVAHNIFLETLVELGIVGFILYSASIVSFTIRSFKIEDKFSFSVISCMIALSLSTSIYTFKPYFNIMLYIIVCLNKVEWNKVPCRCIIRKMGY